MTASIKKSPSPQAAKTKRPIDYAAILSRRKEIPVAIKKYRDRGWKLVPIPADLKHPNIPGWQHIEFSDQDFSRSWLPNIGVQLGPVSGDLCDVDLDSAEARALAPDFLPETAAIFGRTSSPGAHWLYVSNAWRQAAMASTPFDDPERRDTESEDDHGACLVELRTGRVTDKGEVRGAVSMVPPSRHPSSGEIVTWERDGEPAKVDGDDLFDCVRNLAAAALIVRHYPGKGERHRAALVLGGFLARAGWDEEAIEHFMEAVARHAGDEEWRCRAADAKSAVNKLADGEPMPGVPRMRQCFPPHVVTTLNEWLRVDMDTPHAPAGSNRQPAPAARPQTIAAVLAAFDRWLILKDKTPVYAVLGTVAANLLPGDPIWLGLVAPPSSAKTEILNSTADLDCVAQAATLTLGALLSGTPKRQRARGAAGGLLRQIGDFGILVLKDFTSILSMRPDAKNEILAALREIYDGAWTRHVGTDGGQELHWTGKLGLLFGTTAVIDAHYSVIGAMGDRFLLYRFAPSPKGQFERALAHVGGKTAQMRDELRDMVSGLFAAELPEPKPLSANERGRLSQIIEFVVRLRAQVDRDRFTREIAAVYGVEGTARLGLMLERLLAGLDIIGVERNTAFDVVRRVALDSVPPLRRAAYEYLRFGCERIGYTATTAQIAVALGYPTQTTRRALEELAAYGVVMRLSQGRGEADLWWTGPWGKPRPRDDERE